MHTILQILFTLIGIPLLLLLIIVAKIVWIIMAVPIAGLFLILGSENPLFNEEDIIGTYTLKEYNDNDGSDFFVKKDGAIKEKVRHETDEPEKRFYVTLFSQGSCEIFMPNDFLNEYESDEKTGILGTGTWSLNTEIRKDEFFYRDMRHQQVTLTATNTVIIDGVEKVQKVEMKFTPEHSFLYWGRMCLRELNFSRGTLN